MSSASGCSRCKDGGESDSGKRLDSAFRKTRVRVPDTRAVQKLMLFRMLVRSTCSTKLCKRSSFLVSYKQGFRHRPVQFAPLLILSEAAIAVHQGVWRRRLLWK